MDKACLYPSYDTLATMQQYLQIFIFFRDLTNTLAPLKCLLNTEKSSYIINY